MSLLQLSSIILFSTINEFFFHDTTAPNGPEPAHYQCLMITLRHTTLDMIPLDEWSARCRDLYLTTNNNHKRKTSMSLAGFEPAIPSSERPQTHALDRAATKIGLDVNTVRIFLYIFSKQSHLESYLMCKQFVSSAIVRCLFTAQQQVPAYRNTTRSQ